MSPHCQIFFITNETLGMNLDFVFDFYMELLAVNERFYEFLDKSQVTPVHNLFQKYKMFDDFLMFSMFLN